MRKLEAQVRDVSLGSRVVIVSPSNVYDCTLDDDVFVGPFCEIQAGVRVGARTRIQSHSFLCSGVSIGEDCFVGHGVMFVNDWLRGGPARGDATRYGQTLLSERVSVGSNATILPVRICPDVVIGAGSVVTKDIQAPGVYIGSPARLVRLGSGAAGDSPETDLD